MQQASKARAEQRSLVVGLVSLLLSSLQCTAYEAHLTNWGVHVFNVQAVAATAEVPCHFMH